MLAQTRHTESSSSYVQSENKVYVQTRTTVRATSSLSRYTKRFVAVTFGLYSLILYCDDIGLGLFSTTAQSNCVVYLLTYTISAFVFAHILTKVVTRWSY